MLRYLYLDLALGLIAVLVLVWITRRDLRSVILTVGPVGSLIEMVTDQLWYKHDYWHPPVLLPAHMALIEDALYGFAATALAACAVAYLVPPPWARSRRIYQEGRRPRHAFAWLATTLLAYVAMIELLVRLTHLNSTWAASASFAVIGLVGIYVRRNLWRLGLIAGLIMAAGMFLVYFVGLDYVVDGDAFLRHIYLLYGTRADIRVPGTNVLLDELAWNLCRGWCVAVMYPLLTGKRLVLTTR